MTVLKQEKKIMPSANWNGESSLPPISVKLSLADIKDKFLLDEDDGLFINYGIMESAYPYRYQDLYDRTLTPREYDAVVLENDFLRAEFFPCFGGKLWSLFDKKKGKELLFSNSVVRPCNLGVRNAWLSGGIEWNSCFKGHGPFTCSLINTAETKLDDGTPVLRFYYFERIRCALVQMDFFLPENSAFLHVRVRLENPNAKVIPMYWWSNVAVSEKEGDRVIVPAEQSYSAPDAEVVKIDIPVHNGIDVSYPSDNIMSNDYFWKTLDGKRRYICQLDATGYGLCQTSTRRLAGRKLFVWGNSQGGRHWQNFLTADDESGRYDEIQCGLAKTQYECLPMPPHTVWEWLEVYGPMTADPEKIHGDWKGARQEAEAILDKEMPAETLESILERTRRMAKTPAEKILFLQDGWGALENERRKKSGEPLLAEHLVFAPTGEEQREWLRLLNEGTLGEHDPAAVPLSYQSQEEWQKLLAKALREKDKENWYAYYQAGTAMIAKEDYDRAEKLLLRSRRLADTAWTHYALAVLYRKTGRHEAEVRSMLAAYALRREDVCLVKEVLRCLHEQNRPKRLIRLYEELPESIRENARCKIYYAYALARTGKRERAEEILCGKKGILIVPDIRECENITSELWFLLQSEKRGAGETGDLPEPPDALDFRMFTRRDWF